MGAMLRHRSTLRKHVLRVMITNLALGWLVDVLGQRNGSPLTTPTSRRERSLPKTKIWVGSTQTYACLRTHSLSPPLSYMRRTRKPFLKIMHWRTRSCLSWGASLSRKGALQSRVGIQVLKCFFLIEE